MLSQARLRTIMRLIACYDILTTAPLITPWTFAFVFAMLKQLELALNLGETHVDGADPNLSFLASLLGSVCVVWALVRLRSPEPWLGQFDGLAKMLFSFWMIYGVLHGLSGAVLIYLPFEMTLGIAQILLCRHAIGRAERSPIADIEPGSITRF
jgi:hypothetical protein